MFASALTLVVALSIASYAQNLLGNPGLNDSGTDPFPWDLVESPSPQNTAELQGFAHRPPGTGFGLWLRAFEGLFFGNNNEPTGATLTQQVSFVGTPAPAYEFSAWTRWEGGYSGGNAILDASSPSGAVPSPTSTFLTLQFVDGSFAPVGAPVSLDLRPLQIADNTWRQQSLVVPTPVGAAGVLATAGAANMVPNVNRLGGQSAFFDDLQLIGVPEPSSMVLGALGLLGVARRRRV
jgi:hypothetical protein